MKIFKPTTKNTGEKVAFSFSILVAKEIGIDAAILYSKLCEWHLVNKECGFERYDFSSMKNIQKLAPYFTYEQIRFALKKLKEAGFVDYGMPTEYTTFTKTQCE